MEGTGMPLDASRGTLGMPLGFGMALAMNERAMKKYSDLTESEKEKLFYSAETQNPKKKWTES